MPKLPDYEERSALIASSCEEKERQKIAEVSEVIREGLKASATELINLTRSDDESIRLQAVKHHLKLGGLEVERHNISGEIKVSELELDI